MFATVELLMTPQGKAQFTKAEVLAPLAREELYRKYHMFLKITSSLYKYCKSTKILIAQNNPKEP